MRKIPQDPVICLSFVNTKLRDQYAALDAFCEDYEVDRAELEKKLQEIGFCYEEAQNQFR